MRRICENNTYKFKHLLYAAVVLLFISGCSEKEDTIWQGKTWVENGVQIVDNPGEGVWRANKVELIEDLVIVPEDYPEDFFYRIRSVEINSDGNIYILDAGNFRVVTYDEDGTFLFEFGRRGSGPREFQQPWGMTLDEDGNVYVSDQSLYRIDKFNEDGEYLTTIPNLRDKIDIKHGKLLVSGYPMKNYGVSARVLFLETLEEQFNIEIFYTYDPEITFGGISLGETFQFLRDGNIYIAIPYPYELRRYNPDGVLEKRILKKESRVKAPLIRGTGEVRSIMDNGGTGPCFLTSQGFLLNAVRWYVPGEEGRELKTAIDFFNKQGHYLGSVNLPNTQRLIAVDSDDRFYVVQTEPSEKVIRYRLDLPE